MVRFQDPPGTGCWIYAVKNITIQEERFMMTISQIKEDLKQYDRKQLYKDKVTKMQYEMKKMGVDGIICFKPQNTFYLSGFNPYFNRLSDDFP